MADRHDADYEVGYGKTPKHSRFKKGKSGNPGGRPKNARGLKADLEAELNESVTVTVNGRQKRIKKRRLVISSLTNRAIKGHVPAADKLLGLIVQAFGFEEQKTETKTLSDTDRLILEQFLGTGAGNYGTGVDAAGEQADNTSADEGERL